MSNRIPPVPSGLTGPLATYLGQIARQLNGEAYLSIFSGTTPESLVTGIPGNLTVNIGVSDVDRLWIMSGTTARQKRDGWEAAGGGSGRQHIALMAGDSSQVWTNMPDALTEFDGTERNRTMATLTGATRARVGVAMLSAGSANAEIRAQYSVDQGSSWTYLENGGTGPKVNVATSAFTVGSWVTIQAAAQADVWLRPVGINGGGVADPSFGNITLEVE